MHTVKIIDLLKKHVKFSKNVDYCIPSKQTIGYGYNLDVNPLHLTVFEIDRFKCKGITEKCAENLLIDQVYKIKFALDKQIPWWSTIGQTRRDVLINMAYSLGINELLKFKKTLNEIEAGNYEQAAKEMLDSNWVKQVPNHANELSEMMRTGVYQ